MLYVNTIAFNEQKACINSYSNHPLLMKSMPEQVSLWAVMYPNATVKTERMTEDETRALVANGVRADEVGQASL